MAIGKKYLQDNPECSEIEIDGDSIGKLKYSVEDFYKITELSFRDINTINKGRINKSIYTYDCMIPENHSRVGVDVVEDLIAKSIAYYGREEEGVFENTQQRDIANFSWIPLELFNREYDPRKRNIYCPEKPFNIPIDSSWSYYNFTLKDVDISGQFAVKGTIDLITQIDDDTLEIIDWKGLPIETPIATIDGWSTMGELNIGDIVFDMDGIPTKVLAKSKQSIKPCYKITFDDTSEVICDNEHLWKLEDGSVKPITDLKVNDKILVAKPIITKDIELPIDPYVLGVWLGDGRNREGNISGCDRFIFEEMARRGYEVGKDTGCKDTCEARTVMGLTTKLRALSLLHNKHIPDIYFRASINQRLDLLRGLLDTDGSVNPLRKQAIFTNCHKRLSDDFKQLALSLGQRPLQSNVLTNTNFKDNVKVYPISFRPININPFLLPRKSSKILNWGTGNSHRRLIKKIELIGDKLTQCIMVDSPTNTYLCTKNMIPTHNTGSRKDWGTGKIKDYEYLQSDKQLLLYYYAARKTFPQFKNILLTIMFIRDGGSFTLCYDNSDLIKAEKMLEDHFHEVSNNRMPRMIHPQQKDFKCQKLCHFYKNSLPNTQENICKHITREIRDKGIEKVVDHYISEGFSLNKYNSPGA